MSVYKKYNGKDELISNTSIIDHSQLTGTEHYGCHPISAIRKLPEKLTKLKDKSAEIEEKAKRIDIKENEDSTFTFTNYEGEEKTIQSGFLPDDDTIGLVDNKMTLKKVYSDTTMNGVGTKEEPLSVNIDNSTIKQDENNKIFAESLKTDSGIISGENIKSELESLNEDLTIIENTVKEHQSTLDDLVPEVNTQSNKIRDLDSRTKGMGGYLNAYDFKKATPTQDELTEYALEEIGITEKTEIFNQTKIKNLYDGNIWVLTNTPTSDPIVFEWANVGQEQIADANNDGIHGLITGSYDEYYGKVDSLGRVSINGLKESIEDIHTNYAKVNEENTFTKTQTFTAVTSNIPQDAIHITHSSVGGTTANDVAFYNSKGTRIGYINVVSDDRINIGGLDTIYSYGQLHLSGGARPTLDVRGDLGMWNARWDSLYLANNLSDGTNEITVAELVETKKSIPTVTLLW